MYIQALAMVGAASIIHAEYPIKLGSLPSVPAFFQGNTEAVYIDLLNEASGEIWEIKPIYDEAVAFITAQAQITMMNELKRQELLTGQYPIGLPYNWNFAPRGWLLGASFPKIPVLIGADPGGYFNFYAQQTMPGVIVWYKTRNQRRREDVPNPIYLPEAMIWNPQTTVKLQPVPILIPVMNSSVLDWGLSYNVGIEQPCVGQCEHSNATVIGPEASRAMADDFLKLALTCVTAGLLAPYFYQVPQTSPAY